MTTDPCSPLQKKIKTGLAIQKYTQWWIQRFGNVLKNLRSIPAEPFKNSQPTIFFFFNQMNRFVCFDDREITEICSLFSHHILTPNELVCLTPVAIRRCVIIWSLDRPFICLSSSKMTSYLTFFKVSWLYLWILKYCPKKKKKKVPEILWFCRRFSRESWRAGEAVKTPVISA